MKQCCNFHVQLFLYVFKMGLISKESAVEKKIFKGQSILKEQNTQTILKCKLYNWIKLLDITNVMLQGEVFFGSITKSWL